MAKCIFIIDLPGSGKSFKANQLQKELGEEWKILDDPTLESPILFEENVIICDPHLCNSRTRDGAISIMIKLGYEVKCMFFENDKEKCLNNIRHRDDGRVISKDGLASFQYEVPDGIETLKIWQAN